jgi:hypothetical protein
MYLRIMILKKKKFIFFPRDDRYDAIIIAETTPQAIQIRASARKMLLI